MERVQGLGGIFFKSKNPKRLAAWYRKHLGVELALGTGAIFSSKGAGEQTVWSVFEQRTTYFKPSKASFMLNYRVADLDAMLAQLRRAKVKVEPRVDESEYGRFAWASDPDGNRFELWQPPAKRRGKKK